MTERPILFNAEMVRAILAGRKTQTRRILTPGRRFAGCRGRWQCSSDGGMALHIDGQPCDRLWIKETWAVSSFYDGVKPSLVNPGAKVAYAASGGVNGLKLRPSIFMPRWASRIDLEVTGIRVERLRYISEDDARAEGVGLVLADSMPEIGRIMIERDRRAAFAYLWDSINGKRQGCSWADNPWLWCAEFRRAES